MSAWKEYEVTLTIRLTTTMVFARDTEEELAPISKADAIGNAIESLPFGFEADLNGEGWSVALPIDGEAEEL